jgi:LmbE family N-acetylglucosaminyl deacetylase
VTGKGIPFGSDPAATPADFQPRRALVVAAHPDDAEFGAGGTIARFAAGGAEVRYVVATDGSRGTKDRTTSPHALAELRETEQRRAAETVGVREVHFLRHGDGTLEPTMALRAECSLLIRTFRPDVILTHDPWKRYMIHPDHRAIGHATLDGLIAARDHLFQPEQLVAGHEPHETTLVYLWAADEPDLFVDIADTLERKVAAIGCHASQVTRIPDWQGRIRTRARDAASVGRRLAEGGAAVTLGGRGPIEHAEAFKRLELF